MNVSALTTGLPERAAAEAAILEKGGSNRVPVLDFFVFSYFRVFVIEVGLHQLDLLVDGQIVVELKAIKALEDVHFATVRSYLSATGLRVGLLLNFNASTLVVKRIVVG